MEYLGRNQRGKRFVKGCSGSWGKERFLMMNY